MSNITTNKDEKGNPLTYSFKHKLSDGTTIKMEYNSKSTAYKKFKIMNTRL